MTIFCFNLTMCCSIFCQFLSILTVMNSIWCRESRILDNACADSIHHRKILSIITKQIIFFQVIDYNFFIHRVDSRLNRKTSKNYLQLHDEYKKSSQVMDGTEESEHFGKNKRLFLYINTFNMYQTRVLCYTILLHVYMRARYSFYTCMVITYLSSCKHAYGYTWGLKYNEKGLAVNKVVERRCVN